MLFYTEIFSRPILFKDWKPIQCKSKEHHQIHNLYSVSVHSYIFCTLLFVYTLICQRRRLYFAKTKIINILKIINGIADERWKTSVLKITRYFLAWSYIMPSLKLFLLGFLFESFCSAVLGCTFQWIYLKR